MFSLDKPRWSDPPRLKIESILCFQFRPVVLLLFFWRIRRPQNVKKTATSMPEAAAVVARISVGHALSRVPDQATIVIFFGANSSLSGCNAIALPPRGTCAG